MKPKATVQCSQEVAIFSYLQPRELNAHPPI